ncbi:MAG TPA: DUF2231 domain-containing protein [Acidimicrobiales bacterium]|nr:DUF2231 domain-containing protein [Acidimicrobiales bacterium]
MEFDELFGIPAHPLLVHAAVVLLPLAAVAIVIVAAVPRARRHYAPIALVLAILALGSVGLAQGSGESLEERVTETQLVDAHASQGESVLPWAIAVAVVAAAIVGATIFAKQVERVSARTLTAILLVAALISGAGAVWTVIDVGHSGAKATWDDVAGDGGD